MRAMLRSLLPLGLLVALWAATSLARPAPPLRDPRGAARDAVRAADATPFLGKRASERAPADDALAGACASRLESITDALLLHAARPEQTPLPTTHSTDAGEIAVLEDDGTFFFTTEAARTIVDMVGVSEAFYRTHGDDYDALAVYLSSGMPCWLGSTGAIASCDVVRNDVQGIGLDTYDFGATLGSPSRLHTFLTMNALSRYPNDPDAGVDGDTFSAMDIIAHEFGHRWLAYVSVDSAGTPSTTLLGRDLGHWSFFADVDSSYMEGCDWISPAPDSFRTDGVSSRFGMLDQYLMGLRTRAETDSFFVVGAPTAFQPPGGYVNSSDPFVGLGCRGHANWWHVADIEGVHGPRVPDAAASPHAFHVAFVLLTPRGVGATPSDLAKLETIRSRFPFTISTSTEGRCAVDATIDSRAGRVAIAHRGLRDGETAFAPRAVGARVGIEQAGIPIALDASSVRAWWRLAGGGGYSPVALASVAPDSFAGSLPGQAPGTRVEYYLTASSDSAGIDAAFPPGGGTTPLSYLTGPDTIPPVIAHVALAKAPDDQLPKTVLARVTDNLGVDSVWVEYSVNGGPLASLATTPAGADSFAAPLAAGQPVGARVAYRFVARDASSAHQVAYSRASFDTCVIGRDWQEEFENGGGGWTSAVTTTTFRNPWHLSQEQSFPPGGTSWKAGSDDGAGYPPHLDAVLYSNGIYPVVPGTLVRFEHRYDLEEADATHAYDGARVELLSDTSHWDPIATAAGYTHTAVGSPLHAGTPCWSGKSNGWKSEVIDLSPWAGQAVRLRFHMGADDFVSGEGWFIDHVRVTFPSSPTADVGAGAPPLAIGTPWPNPANDRLRLSLALPRAASVEWSLYDLGGRRVATLARRMAESGRSTLEAGLPSGLASGVYFSRLTVAGRHEAPTRIAIVR